MGGITPYPPVGGGGESGYSGYSGYSGKNGEYAASDWSVS